MYLFVWACCRMPTGLLYIGGNLFKLLVETGVPVKNHWHATSL